MKEIRLIKSRWLAAGAALLAAAVLLAGCAVYARMLLGTALDGRRMRADGSAEMTWFELREQMFSGQADTRVNGWLSIVDAEEVSFKASRGMISATHYAPVGMKEGAPWVIALHGGLGTDRVQVRDIACSLSLSGYHVLTPDLYAHGKSEGMVSSLGVCDALDVEVCVEWVLGQDADAQIALFGQDEGGMACLLAGADGLPPAVKAIAVDSVYASAENRAMQLAEEVVGERGPLSKALISAAFAALHGESLERGEMMQCIRQFPLPLLVIHGTGDKEVPAWNGEDVAHAAGKNAQLYFVEGAAHGMARFLEPQEYRQTLLAFFAQKIEGESYR